MNRYTLLVGVRHDSGFYGSDHQHVVRIPCENEHELKRLAGAVSEAWAASMRMEPQITPMGMMMVPSSDSPVIHIPGPHGTIALRVADIVSVIPEVREPLYDTAIGEMIRYTTPPPRYHVDGVTFRFTEDDDDEDKE